MCGIAGVLSTDGPLNPEIIHRALPVLKHRGPDEHQTWRAEHGRVTLGHTRLSIIGLQNGQQPLSNEDGRIRAVVNGEFYDFEKIRSALIEGRHSFRTESDSEIAVHLYEEMGMDCLQRLRGEFAFVIWDENTQILRAVRDRFGIKPLYYSHFEGRFYFASEIKALIAMGVPAKWDKETVLDMNSGFLMRAGRTLFEGIFAVPPGHYLEIKKSDTKLIRYWDFDYPRTSDARQVPDFQEATQQVREKLMESVQLRLRSDVPVCVYLSGGIDSCSVLGMAARIAKRPLSAFTLSFNQSDYDETSIAREMAAHSGADFCPIEMKPQDLADHFAEAVVQGETLMANTHAVAKFLLSKAVRNAGFKVVLTGEGSDEIFGGYPPFKRDLILHNVKGQEPSEVEAMLAELKRTNSVSQGLMLGGEPGMASLPLQKSLGFVPSYLEAFLGIGSRMAEFLNPDYFRDFDRTHRAQFMLSDIDVDGQMTGREPVHQSMYIWSKTHLPNYILTVLGDRMEMAHSVEGRVPFLDHELVELVTQLPVSYKIRGLTEKYILREAVQPVLTETVYKRQKHPFLAPPATLNPNAPLFNYICDTLRSTDGLSRLPFFNRKAIMDLMDHVPSMTPEEQTATDPVLTLVATSVVMGQHFNL